MANQYTVYQSTDASAPVLNPALAGGIISVLDACLVNGYGSKAAAGWTKPFSGTNLAAYLPPTGIRNYLYVDNTGTNAIVNAYESMTSISSGTHPYFSSSAYQIVGGASPAFWRVFADAVTVNMFAFTGAVWLGFVFGEFFSFVTNDSYRGIIRAASSPSPSSDKLDTLSANNATAVVGGAGAMAIDRGHTGVGGPIQPTIVGDRAKGTASGGFLLFGIVPYPNPADGGAYLSPVWLGDPTTSPVNGLRGRQRGFWHWLHPITSVNDGDTLSGTGDLAGRSFMILKPTDNGGVFVMETSATLETN